jgi:2-dehydro-3-deoxygluconokinase
MDDLVARTALALPTLEDEQALRGNDDGAEAAARRLRELGAAEVAVKLGPDGAFVLTADVAEHVAAPPDVEVVDTTDAGDAFDAGYLHARIAGGRGAGGPPARRRDDRAPGRDRALRAGAPPPLAL